MLCDVRNDLAAMIPPPLSREGGKEHSPNSVQLQYLMCLPPLPRPLRTIPSLRTQCLPRQWIQDLGDDFREIFRVKRNSWFHVQADSDPEKLPWTMGAGRGFGLDLCVNVLVFRLFWRPFFPREMTLGLEDLVRCSA